MIQPPSPLPPFSLPDQDGVLRTNADYLGRWLVIFAYPEDDTPNCTLEARAFTEARAAFEALGAAVMGLSHNGPAAHRAFCDGHHLAVDLLADPTEGFIRQLGIPQGEWKGSPYWERTTLLVDPQGLVRRVWNRVDPLGHELEVLRALAAQERDPKVPAGNVISQ